MTILLVDDNKKELQKLLAIAQEWQLAGRQNKGRLLRYSVCSTAQEALEALDNSDEFYPDVAILDIYMPEMKGTELASIYRKRGFSGPIAFLTSSNDFAAESYEVKAFAYLLKPINKSKVFKLLDDFEEALHKKKAPSVDNAHIVLKTKSLSTRIFYRELKWVEVKAHSLYFYLEKNGAQELLKITGSLKALSESLMQDPRFAAPHNSFIVNMDFVATVKSTEVIMLNGESLPISRRHLNFKELYVDYTIKKSRQII